MRDGIAIREAVSADWPTLAAIHAASWRSAYRGLLPDHFLDHEAQDDRARHWCAKSNALDPARRMAFLAEAGRQALGFAYVDLDGEPAHGAFLDNLHVVPGETGRGIGRLLLGRAARWAGERVPGIALHLVLLDGNDRAARFCDRLGAERGERVLYQRPEGTVPFLRYRWPDSGLLASSLEA